MGNRAQPIDNCDRVDRIIRWLRSQKDRIEEPDKGKITFDFAGCDLVARLELTEHIEKQKI